MRTPTCPDQRRKSKAQNTGPALGVGSVHLAPHNCCKHTSCHIAAAELKSAIARPGAALCTLPQQVTPTSSPCVQSVMPHPANLQFSILDSDPLHWTLSIQILPVPRPKRAQQEATPLV